MRPLAANAKHRAPGGITQRERDDAVALFVNHCDTEYELVAVNRSIIDRAVNLTQNHRLRGYDAVQLATALVTNEVLTAAGLPQLIFVGADDDLVTAAGAEGLATENPNLQRATCERFVESVQTLRVSETLRVSLAHFLHMSQPYWV